jgi:hypothetical protein
MSTFTNEGITSVSFVGHPDRVAAALHRRREIGSAEMTGSMVAGSLDIVYAYTRAVRPALTEVHVLASPTLPIAAPEIGAEIERGVVGGCR